MSTATTNPFTLERKTVLVVGASSGIGAATSRLASELGANVLLASRSREGLETVCDQLTDPSRAAVLAMDYLDPASVQDALTNVRNVDHVLISAAADENKKRGAFLDLDEEVMRASFDKFWGHIHVARAITSRMTKSGSLTMISSIAGVSPTGPDSGLSIMNGVQAAIIQTGKSLARELAPKRVNIIAPGVVLTNVWNDDERKRLAAWMEKDLPVARTGEPEHIAAAAVALMINPYITGIVLPVDGGLLLN
jgi:NAD(P)-dependent dehydrogenase (short-subunit alcohol dehydrogenase family)